MAKYYGEIGYGVTAETRPGVWEESITKRKYYGDILSNSKHYEKGEGLNDNLNVNNEISIIADPFAFQNFANMRYIVWLNTKWKITVVKVEWPRLILTIGGVYNEPET